MNYKELIIKEVASHFAKAHLKRVRLIYNLLENSCNVYGLTLNNKEQPVKLDTNEITMIQKLLITKAKKIIGTNFTELILSLNVENRTVNTYIMKNGEYQQIELL
jgi:hypothetical protein